MSRYHQSYYSPKFPAKYKGDPTKIFCRSSWERAFAHWCDYHQDVIEWGSETTIIPYVSPLDSRYHRYYLDFKIKVRLKDGSIKTYLVEIKPQAQTKPPKVRKKPNKNYLYEVQTWGVNEAKWKSAVQYAKKIGAEFIVLTEKHLFGQK